MRCTRNARLFVWIAVLVTSVSIPLHRLTAQTDSTPTAELLKRLGEAVDGHRSGGQVYVVATSRPPYVVSGVYETRARADTAVLTLARKDGSARVFGPYTATTDGTHVMALVMDTCAHYAASRIDCPPGTSVTGAVEFVRAMDVESVVVTIRLRSGATRQITYGPDMDALFFSPAAIDKFVIPYYVRIMGVDSAAAYRRRLLSRLP
jgi:hypothetical protein